MTTRRTHGKAARFALAVFACSGILVACSARAVQRDAVCDRSSALDLAVSRSGELADNAKNMNAAVLRNQLDEDLANLTAALDVAPNTVVDDLSALADRLRDVYGALELLDWDPVRFVSDERLDSSLGKLGTANTKRHLARINDFLLKSCAVDPVDALPPPDSIIAAPPTSTSIAVSVEDPIPGDQNLLTAHVAMGSAIAESLKISVSVDQAECLGREADDVSLASGDVNDGTYESLFRSIFITCGVNVPDRQAP